MEKGQFSYIMRGKWNEIVIFGEKVYIASKNTIEELDISDEEKTRMYEELEKYNEWRPKVEEETTQISEKTAESVSTNPPKQEDIQNEIKEAGKNMRESLDYVEDNNPSEAGKNWKKSTDNIIYASGGWLHRIMRRIEELVYKHIMTAISPYYFDTDLLSVSLSEKKAEEYVFEVNPNNDMFRKEFDTQITELDDRKRWHMDSQTDTESHKDAESIDAFTDTRSPEQIENEEGLPSDEEIGEKIKNQSSEDSNSSNRS